MPDQPDPSPPEAKPPPLSRRRLALLVAPLVVLVIASQVGDALAPQWVDRHPLWLIALNSRNRNLILVTNNLDAIPYYAVATVRLLVSDPLFYVLGFFYGDRAVAWMERQSSTFGRLIRSWEDLFLRASYPLVFIAPNNIICLFAGSAGMRPGIFATLNVSGTIVRLYLIRRLGDAFSAPLDSVIGFIQDYRLPLTLLSVGFVVLTIVNDRRAGKGELQALTHIEDELGPGTGSEEGRDSSGDDAGTGPGTEI